MKCIILILLATLALGFALPSSWFRTYDSDEDLDNVLFPKTVNILQYLNDLDNAVVADEDLDMDELDVNDKEFTASEELELNSILSKSSNKDMPPYQELAKVARYIVHKSDWASIGTISTLTAIKGFPMVNVLSVADSARNASSTGRIYFYITDLDISARDMMQQNKVTMLFNNDIDRECSRKGVDPMDPTCGRTIISGYITNVKNNTSEFGFAHKAYVSRHPAFNGWNKEHKFYLCRLQIDQIIVLDYFGGIKYVSPKEYYAVTDVDGELEKEFSKTEPNKKKKEVHIRVHGDTDIDNIDVEIL